MRRLPIFIVIDVSESMAGEPLRKVEQGLRELITSLQKDPYALETAYISIIVFAGQAKTVVPLTEIAAFYPPKLSIGSGTNYGNALSHLQNELSGKVRLPSPDAKGDWKPLVFFMTDGSPTDNYAIELGAWELGWKRKSSTIAVAIGQSIELPILSRIATDVLQIDDQQPEAFNQFFKWVTASIRAQSQSIEQNGHEGEIDLKKAEGKAIKKIEKEDFEGFTRTDEKYAIFYGLCQNSKEKYLLKYRKDKHKSDFLDLPEFEVENYRIEGAFLLDLEYDSLRDQPTTQPSTISTELLRGIAPCPSCGNRFSLCICQCGGIFCIDDVGLNTCPHCDQESTFGSSGGHIDIEREIG